MILGYSGRLHVITKFLTLISERGESVRRDMMREREVGDVIASFEDRRGPPAEDYWQPLKDGKNKETNFPLQPLKGKSPTGILILAQ